MFERRACGVGDGRVAVTGGSDGMVNNGALWAGGANNEHSNCRR